MLCFRAVLYTNRRGWTRVPVTIITCSSAHSWTKGCHCILTTSVVYTIMCGMIQFEMCEPCSGDELVGVLIGAPREFQRQLMPIGAPK